MPTRETPDPPPLPTLEEALAVMESGAELPEEPDIRDFRGGYRDELFLIEMRALQRALVRPSQTSNGR